MKEPGKFLTALSFFADFADERKTINQPIDKPAFSRSARL